MHSISHPVIISNNVMWTFSSNEIMKSITINLHEFVKCEVMNSRKAYLF